jgi:HlyD family secretion protein
MQTIFMSGFNCNSLFCEILVSRATSKFPLAVLFYSFVISSCNPNTGTVDAYGNFEATETIVSAEATGKILKLDVTEGERIDSGRVVALIDTLTLHLNKEQLLASRRAVNSRSGNVIAQADVLKQQLKNLANDSVRIANLLEAGAATQKQFDDINGQMRVAEQQLKTVYAQNPGIASEIDVIDKQIEQVTYQLEKSVVVNPVQGTVLARYAEPAEVTAFGKPLYKIANLDTLVLRAYISGAQLPGLRIGQTVSVRFDKDGTENERLPGTVSWISSTAEFTPKTIQTKEERVGLVYAVKILVHNDGRLKIGMPGEVVFSEKQP